MELYLFDRESKKHLRTVDARDRSVVVRSFSYDAAGFLQTIDEGGLVTTIERGPNQATITGPYNQKTVVRFDSSGYASEISRNANGAASDTVDLSHDGKGMLVRMTDGDGTHVYEYSPRGHLVYDELIPNAQAPVASFQTLASRWDKETDTSYQEFTNGAGETSEHEYAYGSDGSVRTVLNSEGTGYSLTTDGRTTTTTSTDGTKVVSTWDTNAITGSFEPMSVTTTIDGKTSTQTTTAIASVTGHVETTTVKSAAATTDIFSVTTNTDTNQIVSRSPSGVEVTSTYDDAGRTKTVQIGDLLPQELEYSGSQLSGIQQIEADGSKTAMASFGYLPDGVQGGGYVQSVTTPAGTTTFGRDDYV
jgi:hypothetical protein